jgi:hypothetical protein
MPGCASPTASSSGLRLPQDPQKALSVARVLRCFVQGAKYARTRTAPLLFHRCISQSSASAASSAKAQRARGAAGQPWGSTCSWRTTLCPPARSASRGPRSTRRRTAVRAATQRAKPPSFSLFSLPIRSLLRFATHPGTAVPRAGRLGPPRSSSSVAPGHLGAPTGSPVRVRWLQTSGRA